MLYVLSAAGIVAGLIVIGVAGIRVGGAVKGLRRAADVMRADVDARTGMLRARSAAIGVAIRDLRARNRPQSSPEPVRSALND